MLELTTTRHNPFIDPQLHVWGWEIPVYLFLGGLVAGLMVLGGLALWRAARGDDPRSYFSLQAPLLGFVLINLGMGALFLDLAHKLYVWRVYLTFQPGSPMSWGSWVLILVYGALLLSALVRLPEAWPWAGERVPRLRQWSDALLARPQLLRAIAWANIVLGVGLGIYTGILLNTMVARPLWNSAILGPLFLVSGLSAGAAMLHLASVLRGDRPAARGMVGGAWSAIVQPVGGAWPARAAAGGLVRADQAFIVVELLLIGLLLANLATSSASHAAAMGLLMGGAYGALFWGVVVGLGLLVPLALQALELGHRIPHTVLPALLVLVGGYALRWVMVNAGQASRIVSQAAL
ncbi:MAG TPA: NrfD/PsrC family molybdoenzyme membrane anchor subunit [Burkholderiaceae bacterium]|nr:NrfD/PsrC family molybdoenzyme membrane anchor subunit [Burkholderiaceae bacterium]